MSDNVYTALFLCKDNSARSITAECAFKRYGQGKFKAYSAGSQPKGETHPVALRLLRQVDYLTDGLRSWASNPSRSIVTSGPKVNSSGTIANAYSPADAHRANDCYQIHRD